MLLQALFIAAVSSSPESFESVVKASSNDTCKLQECTGMDGGCCGADTLRDSAGGAPPACPDGTPCCECGDDSTLPYGVFGCKCPYVPPKPPPAGLKGVVVAGDSWGTEGQPAFDAMMQKNGAKVQLYNIAVMGTTTSEWQSGQYLTSLLDNAKVADYIWLTLMGNDLFGMLPGCALTLKNAEACGDNTIAKVKKGMHTVLDAIFRANPKVKVVGFGYDILGLDKLVCKWVPIALFPQCIHGERKFNHTSIECFNTEFVKMQAVWDDLAKEYPNVESINLLGTLQAAGGNTKASTGHPDLGSWGPAKYTELNCEHATRTGGFPFIFDKMWDLYWSKQNITADDHEVILV